MSEGMITKKLEEHGRELKQHGEELRKYGKKLDEHEEKLEFIIDYLKEKVATKDELQEFRKEYLQGQDQVVTILKNMQQEMSFTHGWLQRHEVDIGKIKQHLSLA